MYLVLNEEWDIKTITKRLEAIPEVYRHQNGLFPPSFELNTYTTNPDSPLREWITFYDETYIFDFDTERRVFKVDKQWRTKPLEWLFDCVQNDYWRMRYRLWSYGAEVWGDPK